MIKYHWPLLWLKEMSKDGLANQCFGQFGRILNSFKEADKLSRDYGTGDLLYPSEVHTIEAIGNNTGCNISDLARIMGITRGAVQKLSAKLDEKGYIHRFMSSEDNKRIFLELTEKGRSACDGHHDFHRKMYDEIFRLLNMFNKEELEKTITVFEAMEKNFNTYIAQEENNEDRNL
jgi:DNA-binding MarR family transcriptional regulator